MLPSIGRFIYFLLICCYPLPAFSQCISSFPYVEDFESGPAAWTSGGLNSDWAIGIPSKSVINTAGSGQNCWITGGLSNPSYNGGQKSWLQSPCFDFSALTYPYVSFLIFWETERQYDGGNFQYSLNGGSTWINVGSAGGGSDCKTMNWYNAGTITNLSGLASPQQGWSGTVSNTSGSCLGGNGSAAWVNAAYCLNALAGEANVIFRFTFGSGTSCNNYDGIAIDSFSVSELALPVFDFTYTCETQQRIRVNGTGGDCPSQILWDFGDPQSAQNTSGLIADTHTYIYPGIYTVSLTFKEPCFGNLTVQRRILFPEVIPTVYAESCPGTADGAISVEVSGLNNATYSWNTNPPLSGDSISGLTVGTYAVTVAGDSACSQTVNIDLNYDPDAIPKPQLPDKLLICPGEDLPLDPGSFSSYLWNTGSMDPVLVVNDTGTYSVTVTNVLGCTAADSVLMISNCFTGIYVPAAFSPNNDGKNDTFRAFSGDVKGYEIRVFNRYGQEVFHSENQETGWDGTLEGTACPEGVFLWRINYQVPAGKLQTISGRLLLIR